MSDTISPRDIRPCDLCGKPLCHTQLPLFWRVRIERMGVDLNVVRQTDALAMFFRSSQLAEAFAPSSNLAKPMQDKPDELLICERCALPGTEAECIARLAEIASEGQSKRDAAKGAA